jgi:integrase/predicted phosphodiesterase
MAQKKRDPNRKMFTQLFVDAIKPPTSGSRRYWDSAVTGLCLQAYASQRTVWKVVCRISGTGEQAWITIGTLVEIPQLKDARERAKKILRMASEGVDPRTRAGEASATTVETKTGTEQAEVATLRPAFDEFMGDEKKARLKDGRPKNKPITLRKKRAIFENHVAPFFRDNEAPVEIRDNKILDDIKESDIVDLIKNIGTNKPGMANIAFHLLKSFFKWATRKRLIKTNPAADINKQYPDTERDRVLDPDEFRLFWLACDAIGWPYGPLLQVLALLAQRESEIAGMLRHEFNKPNRELRLPSERTKTNRAHVVPLPDLAYEIIERLPRVDNSALMFPNTRNKPVTGFSFVKKRIDKLMLKQRRQELEAAGEDPSEARIEHWTIHDLRRTATTVMCSLKHPPHVVDLILNHSSGQSQNGRRGGVFHVYNRYNYMDERRTALQHWGDTVRSWVMPLPPNARPPVQALTSNQILRFDLISDMHVDTYRGAAAIRWSSLKTSGARVLVDAGDEADSPIRSERFLLEAREHYDVVIAVDGNHYHYDSGITVADAMQRFREFAWANDIVYLDGETEYLHDGVLFIGANGWYDWRIGLPELTTDSCRTAWRQGMDDSRILFDRPPEEYAEQQAAVLLRKIEEAQSRPDVKRIVVVTHTVPVREALVWKPHDRDWNLCNGSFANSSMQCLVSRLPESKISTWCFGHSHQSNDFVRHGIRFINNARGLPGEKRWLGPMSIEP